LKNLSLLQHVRMLQGCCPEATERKAGRLEAGGRGRPAGRPGSGGVWGPQGGGRLGICTLPETQEKRGRGRGKC